MPAILRFDRFL